MAGGESGAVKQKEIEVRQLFHIDEFRDVVRLQQEIWGFPDLDILPMRFLVVISQVGGHVFGGYDGDQMIAICFALPGMKPDGMPYLHSHMLGVLPEYRDTGIGRRLKMRQREEALARGIQLIEWTFDPLELKNAYLNIVKLGAIVRRYKVNQYGITESPLHGGLPTDRCYAEWWLTEQRPKGTNIVERISYPADIAIIRAEDNGRAREIQAANAAKFKDAFARGFAVTGFERSASEGTYLLEPWK